jgi:Fe-S cluster biogenesis protein NfuA
MTATDRTRAIQAVLDTVRPALQADGGDIELLEVVGNSARVRLHGACVDCPASAATLHLGIEQLLRDRLPDFEELIPVGDEEAGPSAGSS